MTYKVRLAVVVCLMFALQSGARGATLYQDDFEDGDFTTADGANGLTWTVLAGSAVVETVDDSSRLGIVQDSTFVIADQTITTDSFTILFDARITWSEPGRFIFLYKNTDNYYSLGLGNDRGIFRMMDGTETQLFSDPGSELRLPHAGGATNSLKIYIDNNGTHIRMLFDRGNDGRDYDIELIDTNAQAVTTFTQTKIGASTSSSGSAYRRYHLDNVSIDDSFVENPHTAVTYYVDAANGLDSRTAAEAQNISTPWKTIQRAALSAFSGDDVQVLPGIYRETVTPLYSGSAASPVTYRAHDPNDKPVVDGSEFVNTTAWDSVSITDFAGNNRTVFRSQIDWTPVSAYQNAIRMFAAQEPNQSDPDDPYDITAFHDVPDALNDGSSQTILVDPDFLTQPQADYWVGATLLLFDGFANVVVEREVIDYIPAENKIVTAAFSHYIGVNYGRHDLYALRHHPGILDQPGEFYVDDTVVPNLMYVMPYAGKDEKDVTAAKYTHGFDLGHNYKKHIVIDGLEIRFTAGNAVDVGGGSDGNVVRNCYIHRTMATAVNGDGVDGLLVEGCDIIANHNNGVAFGDGRNYSVVNSEITLNGNNGIWVGTGGGTTFNAEYVTIRGNYIHHQGGRRSHADNYQMHQVRHILMERNTFIQAGHQNMWCQYTDDFVLRNNLFMNGNLGINSCMRSFLYHNVFVECGLRYDAHLDNHPTLGDYYKPQQAVIRNNIIVDSSLSWPDGDLVDRFDVYIVDHNYFNIESSYTLQGWEWDGYHCGVNRGGSMLVTDGQFAQGDCLFSCGITLTWSEPARLVVLYKDTNNYYSVGLGSDDGIFRMMAGVETQLYDDTGSILRLPHGGPAVGSYTFYARNTGASIELKVARDRDDALYDVEINDTDATALTTFSGTTRVGLMTSSSTVSAPWCYMDDVEVQVQAGNTYTDSFEDGDYTAAEGGFGLTWSVSYGDATVTGRGGGRGVGTGEGSIIHTSRSDLTNVVVKPPDSGFTSYDYRPLKTGPLYDAGADLGVPNDIRGIQRPNGLAPDIGAHEYGNRGSLFFFR